MLRRKRAVHESSSELPPLKLDVPAPAPSTIEEMAAAILHPGVRATFLNGVLMGIKAAGERQFEISKMWDKYAALQSAAAEAPYQMTACCDVCRSVLPGGADSPDGVDEAARAAGWKVEGSHFTCPTCAEAACMTRS